jgi:transcriptional regulator with XRE-family HTH domain
MKIKITKLAAQIGISQGFLSNIILGARRPHYNTAKKIAAATNTNPVLWLEGSPEEIKKALSKNREAA